MQNNSEAAAGRLLRVAASFNTSLEWTSATWPRYAHQIIIAARGQLSSAPQLQP